MSADEVQMTKLGAWWERARVLVVGASVITSIILGVWTLGTQLRGIEDSVLSLRQTMTSLVEDGKAAHNAVASLSERVGKLEVAREVQSEAIRLFWAKDWADLKSRVERVELRAFGQPEMRPAPPKVR